MNAIRRQPKLYSALISVGASLLLVLLLLFIIEGASSYLLFAREIARHPLVTLQKHTRYDPELGWVAVPNLNIPDMYGPGISLRTNSRGFRNIEETHAQPSPGQFRVICSGDSVTFGQFVDNKHTWCSRLASRDPDLISLNMGQVGYGVDQAYLWYLRDAGDLKVDVHIFAFITHDFLRLRHEQFIGFGRPHLQLTNDRLEVINKPVPKRAYYVPWLTLLATRLHMLKTIDLAQKVGRRLSETDANLADNDAMRSIDEVQRVIAALFSDLKRYNDERARKTIFLYIPSLNELEGNSADTEQWVQFATAQAQSLDIPLINLLQEFNALPASRARAMYLDGYHLNAEGNERVAAIVFERLVLDTELAQSISLRTQ